MNDYSDLIFLMGAMIIFSLLSMQTARIFQLNNRMQINGKVEYHAISIAQNEIDQVRWIKNKSKFNNYISAFPKQVPLAADDDTLYYNVDAETNDIAIPDASVESKKVTITVTNAYLKNNEKSAAGERSVKLQFIKSFE